MPLEEPSWWYAPAGSSTARVLEPAGWLYGWAARRRYMHAQPYRSQLPVICIGNFTAGGTGKTPAALYVAHYLTARGDRPAFLTRGYGGTIKGPHWVEPGEDRANRTGDEVQLLARQGPTMIARDRAAGARAIEAAKTGPHVIVMDDGLQNPALAKDLTLAVVDARRGFGNGQVIPAGPLRAPLDFQLELADAVIVNQPAASSEDETARGDDSTDWPGWLRQNFDGPVLYASAQPVGDTSWLQGARVCAYAGIGAPSRFFDLLEHLGARIAATRAFPDHHQFTARDAAELVEMAEARDAILITTEKDHVRIPSDGTAQGALKSASRPLPIKLVFAPRDEVRLKALLDMAIQQKKAGNDDTTA